MIRVILLSVMLCGVCLAETANPPFMQFLPTDGVAPAVVHVHAVVRAPSQGSLLDCRYEWDFGDPGSRFNRLTGWNAAHIYDKPGQYTVTLNVTDPAGVKTTQQATLRISPDTRRTLYVAADGNDANTGLDPAQPLKTLGAAIARLRGDTRILLRRGDTFSPAATSSIRFSNVVIGAYGSDDKPRPVVSWSMPSNAHALFSIAQQCQNILFENLVFDSNRTGHTEKGGVPMAVVVDGTNITLRGCEFRNVLYGVDASAGVTGLLMQDNSAPLETGIRGYFAWIQGSDIVIIGNSALNSTREHIVRGYKLQGVLIAHNHFTNLDRRPQGDPQDSAKGCIVIHGGNYFEVCDNVIHDGPIGLGPLGGPDGWKPVVMGKMTVEQYNAVEVAWAICQNNQLEDSTIFIVPGAHHIAVRNNIIRRHKGALIDVNASEKPPQTRRVLDVSVVNNTGISDSDDTCFLNLRGESKGQIRLENNLFIAPKLEVGYKNGAGVWVAGDSLASFGSIAGNIWPIPARTPSRVRDCVHVLINAKTMEERYLTPQRWNAAIGNGKDQFMNVPTDNDLRPTTRFSAGAQWDETPQERKDAKKE